MADRISSLGIVVASLAAVVGGSTWSHAQICEWETSSGQPGGDVNALAVWDDGNGPALYVGGSFAEIGDVAMNNIARWDGTEWTAVTSGGNPGVGGVVNALFVHNDGSGEKLYVGGNFTFPQSYLAAYNGTNFISVGSGTINQVSGMAEFGGDLYAAGSFTFAGGTFVNRIARWNGAGWAAMGNQFFFGANDNVLTAVGTDSSAGVGPGLFVGGTFSSTRGVSAQRVAKWDGSAWSALAGGMNATVVAVIIWNGDLYAGGNFTFADGSPANRIARWNGTSWSALGTGLDGGVSSLAIYDDGNGEALYVGGSFANAGGVPAANLAKWDGATWSAVGGGANGSVDALLTSSAVPGAPGLFVGGSFDEVAGGTPAPCIARRDPTTWNTLDGCISGDCNGNSIADDLDILFGTSLDCNGNSVPDECDIADGTSNDTNSNDIPDECEPDCNSNMIPDDQDISTGLSEDCNNNGQPDECDIDQGLEEDCNNNGIPDSCDVAPGGGSDDMDGNGIPDECEDCQPNGVPDDQDISMGTSQDCNNNNVPDECDIAQGTSQDCNSNGIPDECDLLTISDDCDSNGVPDECQPDCNANGLNDLCELNFTAGLLNEGFDGQAPWVPDAPGDSSITFNNELRVIGRDDLFGGIAWAGQGPVNFGGATLTFFVLSYTSTDSGSFDYPVLYIDGTFYGLNLDSTLGAPTTGDLAGSGTINNANQVTSPLFFIVDIEALVGSGLHTIGWGVASFDGNGGAGELVVDTVGPGLFDVSRDCNGNLVPDECDVMMGTSMDVDENGFPDECQCVGDVNGDTVINTDDILLLINAWNPEELGNGPMPGPADVNGDDYVDTDDLLFLINNWGPCSAAAAAPPAAPAGREAASSRSTSKPRRSRGR